MSQKDLQFIERALAHPWMFWVYFWKWPRIVRQACAEYDLLAKERDAAKAAHERSERANKIVRDWIHVTHRLSTTPEAIRAIFAAGKRLSILLVFFVVTNIYGQAPPYLRNQWDTNANPLALKVISTNGVHAATNIWELDFTNTATVTVSAVSNANKVMVSFTGSASSGSSSLTNALLHAGPTNGSVDALILTAGNGVTLTTSGTNRIAAIDTNVVAEISDLIWTNDGTAVMIAADTNRVRHSAIQTAFGATNAFMVVSNGGISGTAHIFGSTPGDSSGSFVTAKEGAHGGAAFVRATNCYIRTFEGGFAGGYFEDSINSYGKGYEGGHAGVSVVDATNCFVDAFSAFAFGFFGNTKDSKATATVGSMSLGYMEDSSNAFVRAQSPSVVIGQAISSDNVDIHSKGGISSAVLFNSRDVSVTSSGGGVSSALLVGSFNSATNSVLSGNGGIGVGQFSGRSNSVTTTDGLAFGRVESNERIHAEGSATAAFAFGRDVASTNNWTFGIHYTNTVPFSLAVGANGTTQFRASSNSVVIRSATAPTAGQILTATDTVGTVGWSNAPGSGIATQDGLGTNTTLVTAKSIEATNVTVRGYLEVRGNQTNYGTIQATNQSIYSTTQSSGTNSAAGRSVGAMYADGGGLNRLGQFSVASLFASGAGSSNLVNSLGVGVVDAESGGQNSIATGPGVVAMLTKTSGFSSVSNTFGYGFFGQCEDSGSRNILAGGNGMLFFGHASQSSTNLVSGGNGSVLIGKALNAGKNHLFASGSQLFGTAAGGTNEITGNGGAHLFGYADTGGYIGVSGLGATVGGYTDSGGKIRSDGEGSFVWGYSDNGGVLLATNPATIVIGYANNISPATSNTFPVTTATHLDSIVIGAGIASSADHQLTMGFGWPAIRASTNGATIPTNTAPFTIVATDFTINTWYTNNNQRASISLSFELDSNTTGTAKAGIYVDQAVDGTFETTKTVQALGIADPQQLECTAWLQPGARFAITNLSSGAGSPTVAVVAGSCQWVKQ